MDDLISRQAAIDAVMELVEAGYEWRSGVSRKISLLNAVYCALEDIPSAQPTVDGVPVIRCKDCKYNLRNPRKWNDDETLTYVHCGFMGPDDYCSRAEPKEADGCE